MAEGIKKIGHTITPDDLAQMGPDELREYIRRRLLKLEINPPAPAAQDTEPEDFFLAVFKKHKYEWFQSRFADQVTRLMLDADLKNGEYLSRLFHLVEMLDLYETVPALYYLIGKQNSIEKVEGYYETNPFASLLRLLVRFEQPEGKMQIRWEDFLDDPSYAPIAFNALIRTNLSRAWAALPEFAYSANLYPDQINAQPMIKQIIAATPAEIREKLLRELSDSKILEPELKKVLLLMLNVALETELKKYSPLEMGRENSKSVSEKPPFQGQSASTIPRMGGCPHCPLLGGRQIKMCMADPENPIILSIDELQSRHCDYSSCDLYKRYCSKKSIQTNLIHLRHLKEKT